MSEPTKRPIDLEAIEKRLRDGDYFPYPEWAEQDLAALVKEVYRLREKVTDLKDELNDCNNARLVEAERIGEREKVLTLIDSEIEDWQKGKMHQDYYVGAVRSLVTLRKLIAENN